MVSPVVHTVSLGVAQHIAGNILHEVIYVVLADRGTVKSRTGKLPEGLLPIFYVFGIGLLEQL